jgi:hypothetical protein
MELSTCQLNCKLCQIYTTGDDIMADDRNREPATRDDTITTHTNGRNRWFYILRRIIYFILGIILVLLLLRLIFRLLGAEEAGFAAFLFNITQPLVAPFLGIFNQPQLNGQSALEIGTIIAMLIYSLAAWGLVALIGLFRTGRRTR